MKRNSLSPPVGSALDSSPVWVLVLGELPLGGAVSPPFWFWPPLLLLPLVQAASSVPTSAIVSTADKMELHFILEIFHIRQDSSNLCQI
ncbi:hypothetical protein [Thermobacillus composti]|uniref:hypothetical protein n=1 Tax=Thermobacillus composti TaxID=377615 RepID=UPI001E2AC494|nr:hypothetical protein [Thermobacillus composti]